ncbi:hypothetical protein GCM10028799_52880 [Kribbella italica]
MKSYPTQTHTEYDYEIGDEEEQVQYLEESVEVLDQIEVAAAFWFGLAEYEVPPAADAERN